ncbi:MAG: YggS family pyridoxal phosphate-dependent enzyme [Bacteroidaceae bacterium]|nr:YggS family pyridoxal phosphate-dependent enzyme [Bacteroidaceae bacterium]
MIAENLHRVRATLKPGVRLVAVSKYHPVEALQEAYDAGQRVFGESHVQELVAKHDALPEDIQWHFIGHLQTNKVKYMAPFVSLIHSVDSAKLLKEINKQARKANRVVDVLLQLHVAAEETKFGFSPDEVVEMLDGGEWKELLNVRIVGLMAMATNTDDEGQIAGEFEQVRALFERLKEHYFSDKAEFKDISMGMSGDYLIAQEHGSTMVRVGSMIFGERDYSQPFHLSEVVK